MLGVTAGVSAQGPLSNQVLQLLSRINTWIGQQNFQNLRVPAASIPGDTVDRLYTDPSHNLFFNGQLVAGAGGGTAPHNLLSSTHADTVAASVVRGDIIVGNSTPAWARLAKCSTGFFIAASATDTVCSNDGTQLINLNSANLTGTAAAISGVNITALNATQLTSGTVPLARLSGITTTQIAAGAAIVRSQLSLAAGINLTTDVTGTLPFGNGGTGLNAAADDTVMVSSGAAWVAKTVPDCNGTTKALNYTQSTNTFSCLTITVNAGTVTSITVTVPSILTIGGSPISTSGTFAFGLNTQNANLVWAGPTSGAAATPTFRSLVNADIPTTFAAGTLAASTPWSWTQTWNAAGVVFRAIEYQITDTASAAGSTSFRIRGGAAGTTTEFSVDKAGNTVINGAAQAGTVGTSALGTTALPFFNLVLGTAATNNLTVQPAAFAQGTVATVTDPAFAAVTLPLVKRGTIAFVSGAIGGGACAAASTVTVTGLTSTATVVGSLNAAVQTNWQKGITFFLYPTANTINLQVCNPTAGSITPENATFNFTAIVP